MTDDEVAEFKRLLIKYANEEMDQWELRKISHVDPPYDNTLYIALSLAPLTGADHNYEEF